MAKDRRSGTNRADNLVWIVPGFPDDFERFWIFFKQRIVRTAWVIQGIRLLKVFDILRVHW